MRFKRSFALILCIAMIVALMPTTFAKVERFGAVGTAANNKVKLSFQYLGKATYNASTGGLSSPAASEPDSIPNLKKDDIIWLAIKVENMTKDAWPALADGGMTSLNMGVYYDPEYIEPANIDEGEQYVVAVDACAASYWNQAGSTTSARKYSTAAETGGNYQATGAEDVQLDAGIEGMDILALTAAIGSDTSGRKYQRFWNSTSTAETTLFEFPMQIKKDTPAAGRKIVDLGFAPELFMYTFVSDEGGSVSSYNGGWENVTGTPIQSAEANAKNYMYYTGAPELMAAPGKEPSTATVKANSKLTYNGSAQALVTGSATGGELQYSLDGTNYSTTVPTGTDADTYTVYYRVKGDATHNDLAAQTVKVTIAQANVNVTAPTKKTLAYTGSAQELVNAGSSTNGTIQYSLTSGSGWSASIPTGTDVKEYTVYYQVTPNDTKNYKAVSGNVKVSIAKANASATAPTVVAGPLTYTGNAQNLLATNGSVTGGTLKYSIDDGANWSTSAPTAINAGEYKVYYKVDPDGNHNPIDSQLAGTVIINKASISWAPEPMAVEDEFTADEEQAVVTAGGVSVSGGWVTYEVNGAQYNEPPTAKQLGEGTHAILITGHAGDNYEHIEKTITVAVGAGVIPTASMTAPTAEDLIYNGSNQAAVTAGTASNGTAMYMLVELNERGEEPDDLTDNYSTAIPTVKNAGSYKVYYYAKGNTGYEDGVKGAVTLTVAPKDITVTINSVPSAPLDKNATSDYVIEVTDSNAYDAEDGAICNGDTLTLTYTVTYAQAELTQVSAEVDVNIGTVTWSNPNYNVTVTGVAKGAVLDKAAAPAPAKPVAELNKTDNSISVKNPKSGVEYVIYKKADTEAEGFEPDFTDAKNSSNAKFTGLDKDTEYVVYARVAETEDVRASDAVASDPVKTGKYHIVIKNKGGIELSAGWTADDSVASKNALHEIITQPKNLKDYHMSAALNNKVTFPLTLANVAEADGEVVLYAETKSTSGNGGGTINRSPSKTTVVDNTKLDTNYVAPYVKGYEDGTFGPDRPITRAELAAMIARMLKNPINENTNYTSTFIDVPADAWYAKYIGYIEKYNIVNGYGDGTFGPERNVTREEMAAVLVRTAGYAIADTSVSFTDVSIDSWAKPFIATLVNRGVVAGYTDGTFRPSQLLTRAETVVFINRILQNSVAVGNVRPGDVDSDFWAYNDIIKAMNQREIVK